MSKERLGLAAVIGGGTAAISFWIVSAIVKISCSSRYFAADHLIDPQGTAILVALGFGVAAFAFAFVVLGQTRPDRFEKLVVLSLLSIIVLWLAYVLLDGKTCSPDDWKRYAAYLIVPSMIGSIAVVGRRWIAQND